MNVLSKNKELQIIKAAETAVDYINTGMSPTDALHKIAEEYKLTPDFTRRLAETINTSRMLAHLKTASAERRADEFPIANAEDVIKRMYPEKVLPDGLAKAASACDSTWFSAPPDFAEPAMVKAASFETKQPKAYDENPSFVIKRAKNYEAELKRQWEVKKSDLAYCKEMLQQSVIKAGEYFRSLSHIPFSTVEGNVLRKHGSAAKPLMDALYVACRGVEFNEKRGSAESVRQDTFLPTAPYSDIDEAMRLLKKCAAAFIEEKKANEEYKTFAGQYTKTMNKLARVNQPSTPYPFDGIAKFANGLGIGTIAGGTAAGDFLGSLIGPDTDGKDTFEALVSRSEDPEQTTKIRAIRAKALLNELMTSDPIISGHSPENIITAFNEISAMSPRVSEQPGILRGLLARRLELGRLEPFEASQVLGAEKELRSVEGGY